MQVNEIDIGRLQRLAAWRPQGTPVTSVYVDLDPTGFATAPARATQISSLLADAEHAAERLAAGHAGRASARRDVEALRAFFAGADFEPKGAHGLAVFCSTDAGLFEVLRLPEPVEPAAVVDERPWLEPLIGHERARRCLALVSRRTLRAFADDRDGPLLEQADLADDVHGRHDQGGWSQSRYQRGIEHEVDEHLKRCAEALLALLHRTRYDVLAIGATPELYGRVEAALDPRVRERLIGRFDVDVEQANADEALAAADGLLAAERERRVDRLLDRLRAGIADGRAAIGLAATLEALDERRLETLLYEAGFAAAGVRCERCGRLGTDDGAASCPACGGELRRRESILEEAITAALLQSATVESIAGRPDLGPLGRIAALLRF